MKTHLDVSLELNGSKALCGTTAKTLVAVEDPNSVDCGRCTWFMGQDQDTQNRQTNFVVGVRVSSFAPNECHNCKKPIKVQIFKGLDHCSDDCRKALGKDIV